MSAMCANGCGKPAHPKDPYCSTECFREANPVDLVGDAPVISEEVDLVADAPVLDSLELISWEELALPGETLRPTVRRLLSDRDRANWEAIHGPRFAKIRQEQETLLRKMGEPVEAAS